MAKARTNSPDPNLRDDPRIKDVVLEQRFKIAARLEVLHQAYVCPLWVIERIKAIAPEQRRAGDEYTKVVLAGRRSLDWDIDRFPVELHQGMISTIKRAREKWEKSRALLRMGDDGIGTQLAVDDLCLDHIYPATEKAKKRVGNGLWKLAYFFGYASKPGLET